MTLVWLSGAMMLGLTLLVAFSRLLNTSPVVRSTVLQLFTYCLLRHSWVLQVLHGTQKHARFLVSNSVGDIVWTQCNALVPFTVSPDNRYFGQFLQQKVLSAFPSQIFICSWQYEYISWAFETMMRLALTAFLTKAFTTPVAPSQGPFPCQLPKKALETGNPYVSWATAMCLNGHLLLYWVLQASVNWIRCPMERPLYSFKWSIASWTNEATALESCVLSGERMISSSLIISPNSGHL